MLIKMNLKISKLLFLNKERKEIEYVKDVYKKRTQSEDDSFLNQEEQSDTIFVQDNFVCRSNFNLAIEYFQ